MASGVGLVPQYLTLEAVSHAQKICRFYKKARRDQQAQMARQFLKGRFQLVLLRAEFDENKNLSIEEGNKKYAQGLKVYNYIKHAQPMQFPRSPGGTQYGHDLGFNDAHMDGWHPLEKAAFPKYFATRDVRKREFIERFEKMVAEKKKEEENAEAERDGGKS